jgi:hypothetical protein
LQQPDERPANPAQSLQHSGRVASGMLTLDRKPVAGVATEFSAKESHDRAALVSVRIRGRATVSYGLGNPA